MYALIIILPFSFSPLLPLYSLSSLPFFHFLPPSLPPSFGPPFPDTTSVQNASLIFYETNVLMTCTFATRTPALGCVITLALSNASIPEQFFISQNETGSRQCNVTLNHENAYTITEAVDWESDGTEGSLPIPIEPLDLEDPNNFTALTECPLPTGISCQNPTTEERVFNVPKSFALRKC